MASYSLIFHAIEQPDRLTCIGSKVAAVLGRPLVEVYAILTLPGFVLRSRLTLQEAQRLQETLFAAGCVCSLQPEPEAFGTSGEADSALAAEWGQTVSLMVAVSVLLTALLAWFMEWLV